MKKFLFAGAASLISAALALPAMAAGSRASSENHWPGMQSAVPAAPVTAGPSTQYTPVTQPHYVWQEGYDHGGKWHGHWALVQ